eukprot:11349468-Alexandrium_andersonii.AAC.1
MDDMGGKGGKFDKGTGKGGKATGGPERIPAQYGALEEAGVQHATDDRAMPAQWTVPEWPVEPG